MKIRNLCLKSVIRTNLTHSRPRTVIPPHYAATRRPLHSISSTIPPCDCPSWSDIPYSHFLAPKCGLRSQTSLYLGKRKGNLLRCSPRWPPCPPHRCPHPPHTPPGNPTRGFTRAAYVHTHIDLPPHTTHTAQDTAQFCPVSTRPSPRATGRPQLPPNPTAMMVLLLLLLLQTISQGIRDDTHVSVSTDGCHHGLWPGDNPWGGTAGRG